MDAPLHLCGPSWRTHVFRRSVLVEAPRCWTLGGHARNLIIIFVSGRRSYTWFDTGRVGKPANDSWASSSVVCWPRRTSSDVCANTNASNVVSVWQRLYKLAPHRDKMHSQPGGVCRLVQSSQLLSGYWHTEGIYMQKREYPYVIVVCMTAALILLLCFSLPKASTERASLNNG